MKNKNLKKVLLCLLGVMIPLSITACDNKTSTSISSNLSTSLENSSTSSTLSTSASSSIITSTTSTSSSILSSSSSSSSSSSTNENIVTIAEAIEIAIQAGGSGTSEEYQISGTILEVSNPQYGEMTIQDSTGSLYIYGVYDSDRTTSYLQMSDKPVAGDEITLIGKLKTYNGSPEMDRGYIVSFKHVDVSENVDLTQYAEKTILEAREEEDGSKIKVTGIVAKITYADGMVPNGFYLVGDNSSIYVYDTQVAPQVSVGNVITIAGEKAYYVLGTEQTAANKFGYKGSCQIDNVYLIENDKGNTPLDLSWCEEKTVKEIMDTPVSENITTNIYKVNAVVNRVEGHDFVNYYFNDLDNKTGSYAYSQCSGSDFEYLKEFDGKICTVYLSAINCKSTGTGCFYRFIPIQVSYDNYQFDLSNAPSFAIEYYALEQFKTDYVVDPKQELINNVSSELLGFENVSLSYVSNNEDVVYFEENNGVTTFHTKNSGEATVTITATYGNYTADENVLVKVESLGEIEYTDVKTAIETNDNIEVTVRGVVAASLVNKDGFYLVDDTGLIAVEVADRNILTEFNIGNEIIITGVKEHQKKAEATNIGQSVIGEASLVVNLYGEYEYSTNAFEEITFEELYSLASDVNTDYTSQGYKVTGKIIKVETAYYTNYYIGNSDESKKIQFYSSNGKTEYGYLLEDYVGQEVTVELAICNWNSAKISRVCALAVVTENGKIINTLNWN